MNLWMRLGQLSQSLSLFNRRGDYKLWKSVFQEQPVYLRY